MKEAIFRRLIALAALVLVLNSCDENEEITPGLRPKVDYNTLSATSAYSDQFKDETGNSTVDLTEGNTLFKMFFALNEYQRVSIAAPTPISATTLNNLFTNTSSPFTDITTPNLTISGAALNQSGFSIRNAVATSLSTREAERAKYSTWFQEIATASQSVANTASDGVAGKLGTYLVDADGIETIQVIQKSLIGSLQFDYIANVLLTEGLNADNSKVVAGKNYTALEQNWDKAYGLLTLNPVYLAGATDATRNSYEFGLGAYVWEYNKAAYTKIYPAFLKGRAAIVNNDRQTLEEQALFIRTEMERAIANSALGYLNKWKTGETNAARAHAVGEGLGFLYSMRFAKVNNTDAAFSDAQIDKLIGAPNGFWGITVTKVNEISAAIQSKFGI